MNIILDTISNNDTLYEKIVCPPNIMIKYNSNNNYTIVSLKNFNKGDIIFENSSHIFDSSKITNIYVSFEAISSEAISSIPINQHIIALNFIYHTVNRGNNNREYYGFDTFTNHSCNPNTHVMQVNDTQYKSIASYDINIGDELTQDYYTFDSFYDMSEFICNCGYEYCRKIIRG